MRNIFDKIKNNHRYDYLFFFLLGLISLTWFKGSNYISGGCFTWHVDFKEYLSTALFVWEKSVATGYSLVRIPALFFPYITYGWLSQFLFNNSLVYEKILFYVSFSASGASTYFLLRNLNLKRIPCLIGGLFYMFNPFASIVAWYVSIGLLFPFYAFLPLAVALFIKSMKGEMNIVLANFLIFLLPMNSSFANPAFFPLFYSILFFYFLFLSFRLLILKNHQKLKKTIFLFLKFTGLFLVFSSFWLIPLFTDIENQYYMASNEGIGLMEDLPTLQLNSVKPFSAIRLLGLWSFNVGEANEFYYPWHQIFSSPIFIFLSWISAVIVILGLLSLIIKPRKDGLFWFFIFLLGFILVSGFYLPFANYLTLFYERFPSILRAFRGGFTKLGFLYVLAYTGIFSIGVNFLYGKFKKKILLLVIPIFILGFPFLNGQVIFQGGEYLRSYLVKIPDYYYQFKEWDKNIKSDIRYLALPFSKSDTASFIWENGYQGADYLRQFTKKPILNINSPDLMPILAKKINTGDSKTSTFLASLMNVQKIIFRKDINWLAPEGFLIKDRSKINSFISNFTKEKEIGAFDIYSMNNDDFLPHFYIPDDIIISKNGSKGFSDAITLKDDYSKPGVYFLDGKGGKDTELLSRQANEIWLNVEAEEKTNAYEEGPVFINKGESIYYPYIKHHPDRWFYPLVLIKEKFESLFLSNKQNKLMEKRLHLASKRVNEIITWDLRNEALKNNLSRYNKEMFEAVNLIREYSEGEKFLNYLESHEEKLKDYVEDNFWESLKREISKYYRRPTPGKANFILETPIEGDYEILVKLGSKNYLEKTIWLNKGKNNLSIDLPNTGNLLKMVWNKEENGEKIVYSQKLDNWQNDTFYKISADYNAHNGLFGLAIIEDRKAYDKLGNDISSPYFLFNQTLNVRSQKTSGNTTLETLLSDQKGEWKSFEMLVESNSLAEGGTMYFYSEGKGEFKNVAIEEVLQPTIFARKKIGGQKDLESPKLTFLKINPTKYKVLVEGAKDPYSLIFLEDFHSSWKAYINENISQDYGQIISSYFNDEINEVNHQNIFLNKDTFETWGKKTIDEKRHLLVNGYANSWYIIPGDANNKENYEIIIEFWPQRFYYLGLFISSLTLLASLSYLIYRFKKKKRLGD